MSGVASVGLGIMIQHGVDGAVLGSLNEVDMASKLGITKLGDRRRLSTTLRVLVGETLPDRDKVVRHPCRHWNVNKVALWLKEQGIANFASKFIRNAIDGPCTGTP